MEARLATPNDLESIVEVLAQTLDKDPLIDSLVRPDAKRYDAVRRLLRESARRYYGAALCLPPGASTGLGLRDSIGTIRQTIRIVRLRGLWRAGQTSGFLNYIRPRAPHLYLGWLGANKRAEAETLHTLLSAIVSQANDLGVPVYAEGTSDHWRSLLSAHGFDQQGSVELPGGPELSLMWRRAP